MAVLELDGGFDAEAPLDLGHLLDDPQTVGDLALVVVGHLKDEQVVEIKRHVWILPSWPVRLMRSS